MENQTLTVDCIAVNLHCVHCDYNLRGLMPQGRCPECGQAVGDTLGGLERPGEWVRALHIGLLIYLYNILFEMLRAVYAILTVCLRYSRFDPAEWYTYYYFVAPLLRFVPLLAVLLAVRFLTTPHPRTVRRSLAQRGLRCCAWAWILFDLFLWLDYQLTILPGWSGYTTLLAYITTFTSLGITLGFYWFFWAHLRTLLAPTYPPAIGRGCRRLQIVFPVVIITYSLLSHGLIRYWLEVFIDPSTVAPITEVLTIGAGIAALGVVLWSTWILFSLRRQIHREAPVTNREMFRMGLAWLKRACTRLRYYASYPGQDRNDASGSAE